MEKMSFWRNYRLIIMTLCIVGIGILLRVLPSHFMLAKPLHLLELDLQDLRTECRTNFYNLFHPTDTMDSALRDSPISLILIHEREFAQYGFPPNRGVVADVVNALASHGAKVIAFDMTFELKRNKKETERLASASREAGNVIYPVTVTDFQNVSLINGELTPPSSLETYLHLRSKGDSPKDEMAPVRIPEEPLLSSAAALGHIRAPFDIDGKIRRAPLVIKGRDGLFYPSLSLMAVCLFQEIPNEGITIEWGKRIILDNQKDGKSHWRCGIPIDRKGQIRINYARRLRYFPNRYAFADVHRAWQSIPGLDKPQIRLEDFKGKLVLIGYLEERSEQTPTPLELEFPGVAVHATILENILQKSFVRDAGLGLDAFALFLFTGLMVISQVYPYRFSSRHPRLVYTLLTAIAVGILLGFVIINFVVYCVGGIFLNLTLPLVSMSLACFTAMGYRYVTTSEAFIDNLKQKTEELEQQKAYNELILEHMGNGLIVLDSLTGNVEMNPKAATLLGVETRETTLEEIEKHNAKLAAHFRQRLDTKSFDEFRLTSENRNFQVSLVSLDDERRGDKSRLIAVLTDVTEVERLSAEVQRQRDAQEHHQILNNLIIKLNHDIKNDLNGIVGCATLLRTNQLPPEEIADDTSRIIAASRRIADVVSRASHAIRTGNIANLATSPSRCRQNLSALVDSVIQEIEPRARVANVSIDWESPKNFPMLECHPDSLRKAILNIVINALEAMPNGGKLTIRIEHSKEEIRLRISDTGHGIPREIQDRIFERFFTRKTWGAGMGLAQVKEVIEIVHRGKILVESEVGYGTEFTLVLPIQEHERR